MIPKEPKRHLKVAVVGVGGWGKNHARIFHGFNDICKQKAICDNNPDRGKLYAEKYRAHWYQDVESMLDDEFDLDAVAVCTPPHTQYEISRKLLAAGKHVFLEKPATADSKKLLELYATAKSKGLVLMVGFIERFNTAVSRLKELLGKKEFGDVRYLTGARISHWSPAIGGRGVIMDVAIHDIDMARYLLGEDPVKVYSDADRNIEEHPTGYETRAMLSLKFPSGKVSSILAEWINPNAGNNRRIRELQVVGRNSIAILSYIPQLLWHVEGVDILSPFIDEKGKPRYSRTPKEATLIKPLVWEEPLKRELENFIHTVATVGEASPSGYDGIRALEIAEAALESARKGVSKTISYTSME